MKQRLSSHVNQYPTLCLTVCLSLLIPATLKCPDDDPSKNSKHKSFFLFCFHFNNWAMSSSLYCFLLHWFVFIAAWMMIQFQWAIIVAKLFLGVFHMAFTCQKTRMFTTWLSWTWVVKRGDCVIMSVLQNVQQSKFYDVSVYGQRFARTCLSISYFLMGKIHNVLTAPVVLRLGLHLFVQ